MTRHWLLNSARIDDASANDSTLMLAIQLGEDDAFDIIVARHGPMVYRVAYRQMHNSADAEDLFQATFLILHRRVVDGHPPQKLGHWLYGVAQRLALNLHRKQSRAMSRLRELHLRKPVPNSEGETQETIQHALASLPEHFRCAIALVDFDGLSREQAAQLLAIPVGTLSSRLHAGRRRLAKKLHAAGYDIPADQLKTTRMLLPGLPTILPWVTPTPAVLSLVRGGLQMLKIQTALVPMVVISLLGLTVATVVMAQAPSATVPARPASKAPTDGEQAKKAELFKNVPPVVVKTVPAAGSDDVDPDTKEVSITFSKTMMDQTWSWATDGRYGEELEGEKPAYNKDKKTIVRAVTLKPNTTYAVWINTAKFDNFRDENDNPAVPYLYTFRTGEAKKKK
jgi:RNA polymerase sigma factor (sigma-70 family)